METSTETFISETKFLAHETRSAYNGIAGMLELSIAELTEKMPPDDPVMSYLKQALQIAQKSNSRMTYLLVLGRLKNNAQIIKKTKKNLAELIHSTIAMVKDAECTAKFSPLMPFGNNAYWANIDGTLISIALENMLRNAAEKVSGLPEDQREVKILILHDEERKNITISVINHGEMPAEVQAGFFKQNVSTKYEGTGLGSQIIAMITEAHAGKTAVKCGNGKTTVSMILPI